jgi:hypothetical protein
MTLIQLQRSCNVEYVATWYGHVEFDPGVLPVSALEYSHRDRKTRQLIVIKMQNMLTL